MIHTSLFHVHDGDVEVSVNEDDKLAKNELEVQTFAHSSCFCAYQLGYKQLLEID